MSKAIVLNDAEFAAVMAGLRLWARLWQQAADRQEAMNSREERINLALADFPEDDLATSGGEVNPLHPDAVDALAESLNTGGHDADASSPVTLTPDAIALFERVIGHAETHNEDWETGMADGTYDSDDGAKARFKAAEDDVKAAQEFVAKAKAANA